MGFMDKGPRERNCRNRSKPACHLQLQTPWSRPPPQARTGAVVSFLVHLPLPGCGGAFSPQPPEGSSNPKKLDHIPPLLQPSAELISLREATQVLLAKLFPANPQSCRPAAPGRPGPWDRPPGASPVLPPSSPSWAGVLPSHFSSSSSRGWGSQGWDSLSWFYPRQTEQEKRPERASDVSVSSSLC